MKKWRMAVSALLLVSFIVISAGAFFMVDRNTVLAHASNEGMGIGIPEEAAEEQENGQEKEQEGETGEGQEKEQEEETGEGQEAETETGGTVSGNGVAAPSCSCTDRCTADKRNEGCALCAADYEKCEYVPPRVRIRISRPEGWYRYGSAEVKINVEDMAHSPDFQLEKAEARIGSNGSYMDITDTMKIRITEDCSIYVLATDFNGKVYEENRFIQCFDKEKPTLNAGISGGMLTIQASDAASGVKAVYVNGQEFTGLTNGTLPVRLQEADAVYENFSLQAMDYAGNVSDVYTIKNPYYKNPGAKEEDSAAKLPESVLPTQVSAARAEVADYVNTAEGTADKGKEEEAAPMENTDASSVNGISGTEISGNGRSAGKEFYTIKTESGKIFYLIIDNTKSSDNVYFLTEISENDLLHVTGTAYQALEPDGAAVESALPEHKKEEEEPEKEKPEAEDAGEEDAGEENEVIPEPEEDKKSSALAYLLLILIIGAAAGGVYFFKTYRREGEDFIDDDEEEEEEEIYERDDAEKEEDFMDEEAADGIGEFEKPEEADEFEEPEGMEEADEFEELEEIEEADEFEGMDDEKFGGY